MVKAPYYEADLISIASGLESPMLALYLEAYGPAIGWMGFVGFSHEVESIHGDFRRCPRFSPCLGLGLYS